MRGSGMAITRSRRRWARVVVMLSGIMLCCGCGGPDGPPRYPVSGRVTLAGEPLALGRISFEPDTSQGNRGPGAYGDIVAGRYETYRTMGAVGGPHRVVIEGYAGDTPEQRQKRAPLFPPHVTTVELPAGSASFDFDVPAAPRTVTTPKADAR
jgi:hypothetical protein